MDEIRIGSRINRYEILESVHRSELIGIYKAYDTKLERNVFLKTILHSADYSQEAVDYFLAESRSLAKMSHPNIAKVLDFGYENGQLYLVSEYVAGKPLSELMTQPIPWQEAVQILLPLTEALEHAHSKGVIHRDLKPDNIIINADNQPILSDFSLMRIIEEEETRDMTGTNVGLGSPAYISPEQGKGLTVDFRSDIYSLGVIFFEMVTGRKLFYASSSMEIVIQHIMADPPKPRSILPSLPRSIEEIILNALSKDRDKRYQTMSEFADALKAVVQAMTEAKKPGSRPRVSPMLAGISALGIVLIIAGAFWIFGNREATSPGPDSASATAPAPALTAQATSTPTATPPVAITKTLVNTPDESASRITLPSIPVLPGSALPTGTGALDAGSAVSIVELARWGTPRIDKFEFIQNDALLLAATSAGVYYLDPRDLSYRYFFDTEGALTTLAVSQDGEWVATGDDKGTVAIWNVLDGKRLYRLEGAAQRIELLELSPDKWKLAFTDSNNRIHLWNLRQDLHYPFERKHLLKINRIAFTADGNTLLSGGDDFKIYIWDVSSGDSETSITADQKIIDFDLSSDDQYLAASLNRSNATIQIWDWRAKAVTNTITDARNVIPFSHVAYLPNGQNIVTGSADGIVRVWNALGTDKIWETPSTDQNGNPIERDPVKTISISRRGTRFAVMFENGLAEVWDLVGQTRETSQDFTYEEIKRVVVSPDDRLVVFQGGDSFVEILSTGNSAENARIPGVLPRGNPISPDSRMIAVRSSDLNLYALSPTDPASLFTLYDFPVNGSVNYTSEGSLLTAYAGGILKYWSISSGLELNPSLTRRESRCLVIFRRDDSFLSASSEIGVIYASDNLGSFCQITRGPRTTSEKFLPDGSIIVLASGNQVIQLWDQRTGGQRTEIESLAPGGILDAAISADGKLLAAASGGGTIEIYDLESHDLLKSLDLKTGAIYHVAFSNDGKYVVAGSADGTVRFFGLQP